MHRSSLPVRIALGLLVVAAAATAHAQSGVSRITVKVAFAFNLGDKTLTAGAYTLERRADSPTLTIQSADGKTSVHVPVVTRLAPSEQQTKARLVFDKVGGQSFLSEVWFPGQDGFLLRPTAEEHQHAIVAPDAP